MRNDRSVQLISNNRLMAGPNPVRYSSIMWTSSAATVKRNHGRMIAGSSGLRRYVLIHRTSATRLDPPTMTTAGAPVTGGHGHHDEQHGGDHAEDLHSFRRFHRAPCWSTLVDYVRLCQLLLANTGSQLRGEAPCAARKAARLESWPRPASTSPPTATSGPPFGPSPGKRRSTRRW